MAFILRSIIIFAASMAWSYSQAQQSDDGLTASTHFIVIIRDTIWMQDYAEEIYRTLPVLLFDGSNPKQSGLPIYNAVQDRISVVLAGVRKETTRPGCNFQFSAAPQHYFRPILKLAHPENKIDLRDLLKKSIKPACSFKGDDFSSELARANVITYIQEQLESTQQNIPSFSSFAIIIVDLEAPSYKIKTFLEKGVREVDLALESEKNFPGDFYYILSPKSWTFTVDSGGALVRNIEFTSKRKLRYRVSSAKSVKSMQAQQSEIDKLRSRLLKNEDRIRNDAKEREKLTSALNEATANGEMWKGKHNKLEIELKKRGIFGWLLAVILVLALIGAFLISRKLLRPLRFQGSIPER